MRLQRADRPHRVVVADLVESLFNYPGLGLLFLNSLQREDYPVLLAYTLIGGVLTVVGNFVADLVVAVADRRIELRK